MTRMIFLLAAISLLPGCPLLEVETSVDEACATVHGIQVAAVTDGSTSLESTFDMTDLSVLQSLAKLNAQLELTYAQLQVMTGIKDFSFVDQASVTIASGDPNSTLPTTTPYACADCAGDGPTLDVTALAQLDAQPYIATGSLVVTIDLHGSAPAVAWTMDADVCMRAKASVTY
jgi:hypothetical protein